MRPANARQVRQAVRRLRAALRCADCTGGQQPTVTWDGHTMRAAVVHDPTCPTIPAADRAAGRCLYVIPAPAGGDRG